MSRLCLGIINPTAGGGKSHCLFCCFIFLFHICLFTSRRDSDQSLITEDGLQTWFNDFKQALQVSMNTVRTVYDLSCGLIYLVFK